MIPTETEQNAYETSGTSPPAEERGSAPKKNYVAEGFRNKTKGEGLFNEITYIAVGIVGVTAFSVFATWLLRDTNSPLARGYNSLVDRVTKKFGGNPADMNNEIRKRVDSNLNIAALFTGGTMVSVLPVKWLEDSKPGLVKFFDKKIYGEDAVANDPKLIEAHKELEQVPKQTWKSVFASRVTAFVATFTTSLALGPIIDRYSIGFGRRIDRSLNGKNAEIGKTIDAAIAQSPLAVTRANPSPDRVQSRVFNYIGMDGFYTAITGTALFVFTRVFAPIFDKKDQHVPEAVKAPIPAALAIAEQPKHAPEQRDTPSTSIGDVAAHQRLAAEPQRAAALS